MNRKIRGRNKYVLVYSEINFSRLLIINNRPLGSSLPNQYYIYMQLIKTPGVGHLDFIKSDPGKKIYIYIKKKRK